MKIYFFILILLMLPVTLATPIAISPNILEVTSSNFNSSFILINSNNHELKYSIKTSGNEILIEDSGSIQPNSNKEIQFSVNHLKQDSYIIISFESGNTISPSITLKLTKNYTEQSIQDKNEQQQEQETIPVNPKIKQNAKTKDSDIFYITASIIILLLILIFSFGNNIKYCIGHTGHKLRIFIKKFSY